MTSVTQLITLCNMHDRSNTNINKRREETEDITYTYIQVRSSEHILT